MKFWQFNRDTMKNIVLFYAFCISVAIILSPVEVFAQPITRESIEDNVIGWMKVYKLKGVKDPLKIDNKFYSPAQLSICDSLANWIQASYVPKGGLGDVKKAVSDKLGLYNQYTASLPQSYGAYSKTYVFLKYDSKHKMVPENNLGAYWAVFANQVPGWPIRDLITPAQYYFTMPSFEGYEETRKIHDMSSVANVKPYINFWVKDIEAGGGTDYVLLCKDNKSPFIKITKGEYLQLLEMAIPRFYEKEKKKIQEQNKNNQRSIDYLMNTLNERNDRFLTGLKKTKEKYKDRLGEIALTNFQPSISDLEFADVFSSGSLSDPESTTGRVPVYKIDPEMAELCKRDKPQWILVSIQWSPQDMVEKHMYESIINNFNFDYVYNFFFNPEKVKGQPYKPLRSPVFKEAVIVADALNTSNENLADKNIHFFEDFSTTPVDKTPLGWNARPNSAGAKALVATVDGTPNNWAVLTGNKIILNNLKKPLPRNFSLSYDMIVPENFTWGGKGLALQLAKEKTEGVAESFINVKIRPGSGGANGEVTLETKFPSGYANGTKWYAATGFSNNKKVNRINVIVKKSEEALQLLIDQKVIAEYTKAIPADLLFNTLSFEMSRSDGETEKYYISNIKITKE
jgi:hypothetical protein